MGPLLKERIYSFWEQILSFKSSTYDKGGTHFMINDLSCKYFSLHTSNVRKKHYGYDLPSIIS